MRQPLHVLLPLAIVAALAPVTARAEPPIYVTKLLYRVPRTEQEVALGHEQSRVAALQLAGGSPLETGDEVQRVWYDVVLAGGKDHDGTPDGGPLDREKPRGSGNSTLERSLPYDYTRRGVLCFGTRMSARDQADLPLLTSAAILDRINTNYVSLHVRVHRDVAGGEPYLHYRPEVAVGVYGQPDASIAFAALQQNALRDVRALGLFVKRGEPLSPSRLRTLVIANKGQLVLEDTTTGTIDVGPSLELMFIRARPHVAAADTKSTVVAAAGSGENGAAGGKARAGGKAGAATRNEVGSCELDLHAFATSGDRRRLHYLKPFAIPEKLGDCSIQSTVRITEYLLAGQYPSARAARQIHFSAIASLPIERLDQYAAAEGWSGDALDNLTEILDAIIDGKIVDGKIVDDKVATGANTADATTGHKAKK
jgi:hypothetical protein